MSDQLVFSYEAGPAGREFDGHPDALPGFRPEPVKITDASAAADPGMTGALLFAEVDRPARERGRVLGHVHAGHLVGEMSRTAEAGRIAHWSREIHLADAGRGVGGFHERMPDLG